MRWPKWHWDQFFDIWIGAGGAILLVLALRMVLALAWGTSDYIPAPRDPPAGSPCFVALQVCQSTRYKKIAPDFIYSRYSWITRVGNRPGSPDGCISVTNSTGASIYIVGTEQQILDRIEHARKRCSE